MALLVQSGSIGKLQLKNRILMAPWVPTMATWMRELWPISRLGWQAELPCSDAG